MDDDAITQACAQCGQLNRIPRRRIAEDPTCGRCKQKVFPREAGNVTDATWKVQVEESAIPVLVDFWAPWCPPCRAVGPVLEEIARERAGKLKVVKLNVDENPRAAAQHGIRSIPAMHLFRGPRLVDQQVGAVPKEQIELWLERFI